MYFLIPFLIGAFLISWVNQGGFAESLRLRAYSREAGALVQSLQNLPDSFTTAVVRFELPEGYTLHYRSGEIAVRHDAVAETFLVSERAGYRVSIVQDEDDVYILSRDAEGGNTR